MPPPDVMSWWSETGPDEFHPTTDNQDLQAATITMGSAHQDLTRKFLSQGAGVQTTKALDDMQDPLRWAYLVEVFGSGRVQFHQVPRLTQIARNIYGL